MTQEQKDGIRDELDIDLGCIFPDWQDRSEVIDLIIDDIVADIEETADWSDYDDDEYNIGDIQIATARVLKSAIVFNYTGE